jgi:hypothetical protein
MNLAWSDVLYDISIIAIVLALAMLWRLEGIKGLMYGLLLVVGSTAGAVLIAAIIKG